MKKRKKKLLKETTANIERPYAKNSENTRIIMAGNTDIFIENHLGIIKYTEREAIIKTHIFVLKISGRGLCMDTYGAENIVVSGVIENIKFDMGEK